MSDEHAINPPEPKPIPAPPNFPVAWENPGDAHMFWTYDRMHFPEPVTPLEGMIMANMAASGMSAAMEVYEMPVRAHGRHINTYPYTSMMPVVPPEQMEAQGKRAEEKLGSAMAGLDDLWNKEWLPEIKKHLVFWDGFDLQGAPMSELMDHLDDTLDRAKRLWEIHFTLAFPAYLSISLFDELYNDLFEDEGAFGAYTLLQGFDNKTLETGRAQWELSRRALASHEVRQILEERATGEVLPTLEATPSGQTFLAELQAYLEAYGQRGDKWGLSFPYWIEDPAPVIRNLKDYITQPDRDPMAELNVLAEEREQAVAKARERLTGYPRQVVGQFEFLLKTAQTGTVLTEDHGFWIDFNGQYRVRRVVMAFGQRLANEGVIQGPGDVFYLNLDELRESAVGSPGGDRRAVIEERQAEMEHFSQIQPPPILGMDYGPAPDTPFSRFGAKFGGGPPPTSDEPDVLRGNPGSPGTVRGPARVVRSITEAEKLQAGDILVAETTAPPWTPLFATAGAVVTDTGGILSHCAIVAREYRIPAVVGTGMATARIQDGQLLEVDGDGGLVHILESA